MKPVYPIILPLHEYHVPPHESEYYPMQQEPKPPCFNDPKPEQSGFSMDFNAIMLGVMLGVLAWTAWTSVAMSRHAAAMHAALAEEALKRRAGDEADRCIIEAYVNPFYHRVQKLEFERDGMTFDQQEQLRLWYSIQEKELQKRIAELKATVPKD